MKRISPMESKAEVFGSDLPSDNSAIDDGEFGDFSRFSELKSYWEDVGDSEKSNASSAGDDTESAIMSRSDNSLNMISEPTREEETDNNPHKSTDVKKTQPPAVEVREATNPTDQNQPLDKAGTERDIDKEVLVRGSILSCSVCRSSGKEEVGSCYCITCGCVICPACAKCHLGHSPDCDHVMIPVDDNNIRAVLCKAHRDHLVRVFCLSCCVPVCKLCLSEEHKDHRMSDFTKRATQNNMTIKGISQHIKEQLNDLRFQSRGLSTAQEIADMNRNQTNKSIVEFIDKQIQFLVDKKQQLLNNSNEYHDDVRDEVSKLERVVDKGLSSFTELQTKVDTTVFPLPPHHNITPEVFPTNVIQRIFSTIFLPTKTPRDFGVSSCQFEQGTEPVTGELDVGKPVEIRNFFDLTDLRYKKVKPLWNKEMEVHDAHFLPNKSRDLVSTNIDKNYMLQRLNCDGKLAPLPSALTGFGGRHCVINVNHQSGRIIVGYKPDPKSENLVFTILKENNSETDMSLVGATFPPGYNTLVSLTTTQIDNIVVVLADDENNPKNTCLCCYNRQGNVIWMRNTSPSWMAGDLIDPMYIMVDMMDRIIVSDPEGSKINIYTNDGSHLLSFPALADDAPRVKPSGLCLDSRGRVLVAFSDLRVVSLFTPNGDFIRHVLQTETPPWAISVCDDRYLVVAQEGQGLWMYDLKDLD